MKKIIKFALFGVGALVLLLIVGVFVAVMFINSIAKGAVERGATYALGTPTTVGSVDLGLMGGTFEMKSLDVKNPTGFSKPSFLGLGRTYVTADYSTLRQPLVTLPELTLENLALSLEKNASGANYRVIMDSLKKVQGAGGAQPPTGKPADGQKFVIKQLRIRNVKVDAAIAVVPGGLGAVGGVINKATAVNITIDEIKLDDVGRTGSGVGGTGVTMSELTGIITQAVLSAVADKGGGILPADLLGDLQNGLGSLKSLRELGVGSMTAVAEKLGELNKELGEASKKIEGEVKGVQEKVKGIGEGLGKLIPGGEKK